MKKNLAFAVLVLLVPSFAIAHVSVRPRESKPGTEERYTVRVPTEGTVGTTHMRLEIPAGVTVLEVLPHDGATFETAEQEDRITAITWRKAIPPKGVAEFVFRARNPASGDIVWKAHQHFADGTVADWVGVAGEKRPASVTTLSAKTAAAVGRQPAADPAVAEARLRGHNAAFTAKELDKLTTFYHPDVTARANASPTSPSAKAAGSRACANRSRSERLSRGCGEFGGSTAGPDRNPAIDA